VYSDLLAQKKEMKRHQAKLESMAREEEAERLRAKAGARERVLADFERKHLGLGLATGSANPLSRKPDSPGLEDEHEGMPLYLLTACLHLMSIMFPISSDPGSEEEI
jgi:hypothetical protein